MQIHIHTDQTDASCRSVLVYGLIKLLYLFYCNWWLSAFVAVLSHVFGGREGEGREGGVGNNYPLIFSV